MLKKPITYTDFNGTTVTEDFYFNLTKSELAKMELGQAGGMEAYLQSVIESGNGQTIVDAFEKFIKASYGVKSPDGRKFQKSDELLAEFMSTAAYDVLFMEMVTNAEKGAEFVTGIMPADLAAQAQTQMQAQTPKFTLVDEVTPAALDQRVASEEEMLAALGALDDEPEQPVKDYSKLSSAEIRALPKHELVAAFKQKNAR